MAQHRRRHGLQLPLGLHQIAAYVIILALVSLTYTLCVPLTDPGATRIALAVVYSCTVVTVVVLGYVTSVSDPSDPGLDHPNHSAELYCQLCEAHVGTTSKHCKACGRCTEGFDHHCKWLNNCVGHRNYRYFFGLLVSTMVMLFMQGGWSLWLVIVSFTEEPKQRLLAYDSYGSSFSYRGWQVGLFIVLGMLVAVGFVLGELLAFHTVLIAKDMTTFDYITYQRTMMADNGSPSAPGARAMLCRPNRVVPDDVVVPQRKAKVWLNPWGACCTDPVQASGQGTGAIGANHV